MVANVLEGLFHTQMVHSIVIPTVVRAQILRLVGQHNAGYKADVREGEAQVDKDEKDAAANVVVHLLLFDFMPEGQDCIEDEQPGGNGMVDGPNDGNAQGPYKSCPCPHHEEAVNDADCKHISDITCFVLCPYMCPSAASQEAISCSTSCLGTSASQPEQGH